MFVSGSGLSLLYCLFFVSTPVCGNGAGRHVYMFSVLSSLRVLSYQVCVSLWTFLTADYCPLPHLEAEQVICLETVAVCHLIIEMLSSSPGYLKEIKTLYF